MNYPPIYYQQLLNDDGDLKPNYARLSIFNLKGKGLEKHKGHLQEYWAIKTHLILGPPVANNKTKRWERAEVRTYTLEGYGNDYKRVKEFAKSNGAELYTLHADSHFHHFQEEACDLNEKTSAAP